MAIKILDKLSTAPTGQRVALNNRTTFSEYTDKYPAINDALVVRSSVMFSVNQVIQDEEAKYLTTASFRARKILAREIFGEVTERLLEIRNKLWEGKDVLDDMDNLLEELNG